MNRPEVWFGRAQRSIVPACALLAVSLACVAGYRASSWPLIHDAPLLHYVLFLMSKGMAPYRDIVEMNLPAAYMAEWVGVHVFGAGAKGWWAFDAALAVLLMLASAWAAGSGLRCAGVLAGAMAYLQHLQDGAANLGQRDWTAAVLCVCGLAFGLQAWRSRRQIWMLGAGFLLVSAASIKPPALLAGLLFSGILLVALHKAGERLGGYLIGLGVGTAASVAMSVAFVAYWGVWREFLWTGRALIPYYASLGKASILPILPHALPMFVALALLLAGAAGAVAGTLRRTETLLLLAGTCSGIAVYAVQQKGWNYHKYLALVFGCLLVAYLVDANLLAARRAARWLAVAAALLLLVQLQRLSHLNLPDESLTAHKVEVLQHLQVALEHLGGNKLDGEVQCLDMTYTGCINVLYRMHLKQTTGYIYDYYLFPETSGPVPVTLQQRFLTSVKNRPPRIIVLSSHVWPGETFSYDQVERWPAFSAWLKSRYALEDGYAQKDGSGFRIYVARPAATSLVALQSLTASR